MSRAPFPTAPRRERVLVCGVLLPGRAAEAAGPLGELRALLEAAERRMLEFVPILPLYHPVGRHLVKPWVEGYQPNILNRAYTRNLAIDVEQRGF